MDDGPIVSSVSKTRTAMKRVRWDFARKRADVWKVGGFGIPDQLIVEIGRAQKRMLVGFVLLSMEWYNAFTKSFPNPQRCGCTNDTLTAALLKRL